MIRHLIPTPVCPRCGSRIIIYSDYMACELMECGRLLSPTTIGLAEYSIADLRRMFPDRCSNAPADTLAKR